MSGKLFPFPGLFAVLYNSTTGPGMKKLSGHSFFRFLKQIRKTVTYRKLENVIFIISHMIVTFVYYIA